MLYKICYDLYSAYPTQELRPKWCRLFGSHPKTTWRALDHTGWPAIHLPWTIYVDHDRSGVSGYQTRPVLYTKYSFDSVWTLDPLYDLVQYLKRETPPSRPCLRGIPGWCTVQSADASGVPRRRVRPRNDDQGFPQYDGVNGQEAEQRAAWTPLLQVPELEVSLWYTQGRDTMYVYDMLHS